MIKKKKMAREKINLEIKSMIGQIKQLIKRL